MVHSDRGVQYACADFVRMLKRHQFIQRMSRKGDCWDNAVAEFFFSILKTKLIYLLRYEDQKDTLASIFEYTEIFYNRKRRHSTIGYLAPAQYEEEKLKLCG
jgi:putative transposase